MIARGVVVNTEIELRAINLARYIIDKKATVRSAAKEFGISKSTVHKDVTQILKNVDVELYYQVKEILEINKKERHIRGGEATRIKYINQKSTQSLYKS